MDPVTLAHGGVSGLGLEVLDSLTPVKPISAQPVPGKVPCRRWNLTLKHARAGGKEAGTGPVAFLGTAPSPSPGAKPGSRRLSPADASAARSFPTQNGR